MCLTPIFIKPRWGNPDAVTHNGNGKVSVPCGKCPKCKLKRSQAWIFRLLEESKVHINSVFVTITYDSMHVPITPNGFMTLKKKDWQDFMKRLRKRMDKKGIKHLKYYAVGEYGTQGKRPHYHAIMFDVTQEDIESCWTKEQILKGNVMVGTVTGASIAYTTKYMCKDSEVPLHDRDDREKEFSLMSLGLGKNYITPKSIKWHKQNKAAYVLLEDGIKQQIPRYYKDRIFTDDEKLQLAFEANKLHTERTLKDIENAGSQTEYYRNRFEYARQQKHNYNNKHKRNKI